MDPIRTRHKDVVFANGGRPSPPTNPPLSFEAVQACFQEHNTMKKTCTKHKIVLELFKTHHRGSLFPIGEVVPLFLVVQHRFRYHLAGKDGTHMNPVRTRHNDVVFANGGGAPQPPRCLFKPAGLLSRTSHHEQDLHQTRNCFRAFKTHHKGSLFAERGCVIVSHYAML